MSLVNGGNVKRKNIVNQKRPNRGCIIRACFPTCQVRVSTVLFRVPSLLLPSSFPPSFLLPPTANSRSQISQWALPDLNCELQIAVGAGPQRRGADLSGRYRTSTASCRSQWALLDLNGEGQVSVGCRTRQPQWGVPMSREDVRIE